LSAEEQTEVFKYVLEERRMQAQQDEHPPLQNETEGEAGVEDSAAAAGVGTSDDTCSDSASFVSAVESVPGSRKNTSPSD
jgi:hypothetical protein